MEVRRSLPGIHGSPLDAHDLVQRHDEAQILDDFVHVQALDLLGDGLQPRPPEILGEDLDVRILQTRDLKHRGRVPA